MKVMLFDPGWPQTGYLMICLRDAGFDVVRAAKGPFDRQGLGEYCSNIHIPDDCDNAEYLTQVIRENPVDLVIPLSEEYLMMLWDQPADIAEKVFPRITPLQRQALSHRPSMYELAQRAGVPIPPSVEVVSEASLAAVGRQLGFPFVLRGTQGLGGTQVKIVHDEQQAVDAYRLLQTLSPGLPFAQQYIEGRRCLIGGLFDQGHLIQWFSQTTLESFSPPTGPSVRVMSIRDAALAEYARNLFRELGWTGLACAEFMQTRDGRFVFLEVNPRPWAAIQAAHVCGVPLMRSFTRFLAGTKTFTQPDFPDKKVVCLFPQYFIYRMNTDGRLSWRYWREYLRCLAIAPWGHPRLMLHYLRTTWWFTRRG